MEKAEKYILAWELAKETKDRDELQNQLLNIFLPAHDAVAIALTNVFFHLARKPAIWTNLRQELSELNLLDPNAAEITFERLEGLKRLQHVINETFRLIGMVSRAALRDTTLPVGGGLSGDHPIFIKKGDTFSMSLYSLHRRKEIYGEDADQFRPERWDDLRSRVWTCVPFGGGPRICVGQRIALVHVAYTIVNFL